MAYCRHVYEDVGSDICPYCGKDTHRTDFKLVSAMRERWWAEGKADWSICKECGGTIRGWWSI